VALSVQTLVYLPSLSSRLLLRNIPNFSHYSSLSAMSLSSLNRSNSKAFRHILPRVAPVCEGMHYHKTGVSWQMKSTFIIVFLLNIITSPDNNPVRSYNHAFCLVTNSILRAIHIPSANLLSKLKEGFRAPFSSLLISA